MKRLIILMLLISVLVACGSTKDADKEEKKETEVKETEVTKDEKETEEEKDEQKEEQKEEVKEPAKEESTKQKDNPSKNKKETEKKPVEKPTKKPEKKSPVKNEKVKVAAENIIWAQNNRDYPVLKNYLGQNITLNENNNILKIKNVDYPHDAELLKGIKKDDLEYRFTHDEGKDKIVGFAVIDYETEMSYTIDLTMRVGKDSWKMLNMQINK